MFFLKWCKSMVAARRRLKIDRDSPTVSRTKHLSTHRWQERKKTRATAFPVSPRSAPLTLRPRVGNDATEKKVRFNHAWCSSCHREKLILIITVRRLAWSLPLRASLIPSLTGNTQPVTFALRMHVGVKISTPTSAEDLLIATTI